jgi:hypothetical protein
MKCELPVFFIDNGRVGLKVNSGTLVLNVALQGEYFKGL